MQRSKWVPLKVRCFVWKSRLDRIPCKKALASRNVEVGFEGCSRCFNDSECPNHVLLMTSVIIMAMVWFIWRARNDLIFNTKPLSIQGVKDLMMVHLFLWLKHRPNRVDIMWHKC